MQGNKVFVKAFQGNIRSHDTYNMLVFDMDPEGSGRWVGFTAFNDAIHTRELSGTNYKEHYNSLAVRAMFDAFASGARLSYRPPPCSAV